MEAATHKRIARGAWFAMVASVVFVIYLARYVQVQQYTFVMWAPRSGKSVLYTPDVELARQALRTIIRRADPATNRVNVRFQAPAQVYEATSQTVYLQFDIDSAIQSDLEVQMFSPGVLVDGDKIKAARIGDGNLKYEWICHFEHSGEYLLNLSVSLKQLSGSKVPIGSWSHHVKVVKLDSMTTQEVYVWSAAGTLLAAVATALGIAQMLRRGMLSG